SGIFCGEVRIGGTARWHSACRSSCLRRRCAQEPTMQDFPLSAWLKLRILTMSAHYDLVIRHGLLVDGRGGAPRQADVAIAGDRIVAVGPLNGASAKEEIDASG